MMTAAEGPGCVVILVDESAAMRAAMGEVVADGKPSAKPTAERVATCVNSLLAQFSSGPDFDVAVVGYKTEQGQADVGCRWGGAFAGREFVATSELGSAPLRVENRVRKLPSSDDGTFREETVNLPIWYAPALGEKAPQIAAYDYCRELLSRWLATAGPKPGLPLVAHVFSGASGDGNPQGAVAKLMELATPAGPILLLQVQLAASSALVTTGYPSSLANLTLGAPRDLFRRASVLPAHLMSALKEAGIAVNANARGMLHNAKISDLIRLFGLVKAHVHSWPAKTTDATVGASPGGHVQAASADAAASDVAPKTGAEIPANGDPGSLGASPVRTGGEKIGLVILVLDRAVADPFGANPENSCVRLQNNANDLLKQLSKLAEGRVDVAMMSYGLDANNQTEVRTTFEGPMAGKTVVTNTDLLTGALRVEEFEEQVSNGIGGLVSVTRKKPIYYDVEPAAAAMPTEAFATARRIANDWCDQHPLACLPPIALHLTRGQFNGADVDEALGQFHASSADRPSLIYHLIVTEQPRKSIAYPETDSDIDGDSLRRLWQQTSPLLGREQILAKRPGLGSNARGFVINGKFDLFVESIKNALATA
jgi:hypothetical protein